jgi:hypothetical protein
MAARWGIATVALAVLAVPGVAGATSTETVEIVREPVAGTTFLNPCTGEHMTITEGTLQLLVRIGVDADGGLHLIVHGSAQGVAATGEFTGSRYRLAGDFWGETNGAADGSPLTMQFVELHNVLSPGSADNFTVLLVSHLTVNADGTVTAVLDSASTQCRG